MDFCKRSHLLLRQPHAERRFVRRALNLNLPLDNVVLNFRRNAAAGIGDFNDKSGVV